MSLVKAEATAESARIAAPAARPAASAASAAAAAEPSALAEAHRSSSGSMPDNNTTTTSTSSFSASCAASEAAAASDPAGNALLTVVKKDIPKDRNTKKNRTQQQQPQQQQPQQQQPQQQQQQQKHQQPQQQQQLLKQCVPLGCLPPMQPFEDEAQQVVCRSLSSFSLSGESSNTSASSPLQQRGLAGLRTAVGTAQPLPATTTSSSAAAAAAIACSSPAFPKSSAVSSLPHIPAKTDDPALHIHPLQQQQQQQQQQMLLLGSPSLPEALQQQQQQQRRPGGRVFVGNIPPGISRHVLLAAATAAGPVGTLDYQPQSGLWAFAYIGFETADAADRAVQHFHGRRIFSPAPPHALVACRAAEDFPLTRMPLTRMELFCINGEGPPAAGASTSSSSSSGALMLSTATEDEDKGRSRCSTSKSISSGGTSPGPNRALLQQELQERLQQVQRHRKQQQQLLQHQRVIRSLTKGGNTEGLVVLKGGICVIDAQAVAEQTRKTSFVLLKDGPPGANLFLYGIPARWKELELMRLVGPFGHVVGIRVPFAAPDKNVSASSGGGSGCQLMSCSESRLLAQSCTYSRGFAFASFDGTDAALAAFRALADKVVEGRKLRIQLKNGEEHLLPSSLQHLAVRSPAAAAAAAAAAACTSGNNMSATHGVFAAAAAAAAAAVGRQTALRDEQWTQGPMSAAAAAAAAAALAAAGRDPSVALMLLLQQQEQQQQQSSNSPEAEAAAAALQPFAPQSDSWGGLSSIDRLQQHQHQQQQQQYVPALPSSESLSSSLAITTSDLLQSLSPPSSSGYISSGLEQRQLQQDHVQRQEQLLQQEILQQQGHMLQQEQQLLHHGQLQLQQQLQQQQQQLQHGCEHFTGASSFLRSEATPDSAGARAPSAVRRVRRNYIEQQQQQADRHQQTQQLELEASEDYLRMSALSMRNASEGLVSLAALTVPSAAASVGAHTSRGFSAAATSTPSTTCSVGSSSGVGSHASTKQQLQHLQQQHVQQQQVQQQQVQQPLQQQQGEHWMMQEMLRMQKEIEALKAELRLKDEDSHDGNMCSSSKSHGVCEELAVDRKGHKHLTSSTRGHGDFSGGTPTASQASSSNTNGRDPHGRLTSAAVVAAAAAAAASAAGETLKGGKGTPKSSRAVTLQRCSRVTRSSGSNGGNNSSSVSGVPLVQNGNNATSLVGLTSDTPTEVNSPFFSCAPRVCSHLFFCWSGGSTAGAFDADFFALQVSPCLRVLCSRRGQCRQYRGLRALLRAMCAASPVFPFEKAAAERSAAAACSAPFFSATLFVSFPKPLGRRRCAGSTGGRSSSVQVVAHVASVSAAPPVRGAGAWA
ncbi:polyglutamine-repeat protein pqn-41 [Cyclospora cayetanensis]|uniref:Polyglutamine-repeat protein pqn-41 n=1 Tax=Cyclospora cayetanensis TaxID=88456 RepID=A0A6P6RWS6_9EIME|nr:polyglutamine-repeat protein pqn-41 [Cyclospora cayetanensis]